MLPFPSSRLALLFAAFCVRFVWCWRPVIHSKAFALESRDEPSSPFDHSNIKTYAALGDSFAAGIGAGTRLTGWGDWYCSRYDSSYPSVVNSSPALGDSSGRTFQYFACSGAVTTDVTGSQIRGLKDGTVDLATLTIGGNDAGLKDILHACIYQWNKDLLLDCDKTLSDAQSTIDAPAFASNYDKLLQALAKKMNGPDAKIYFTGYSHFWDTSTNECDKVTWAIRYNIGNRQYLTQARRAKMNDLVDAVNQKIQDAIQRFGNQALYVPWGAGVDFIQGHYCEPGVDEFNANNREQTAFYEWGTTLDDETDPDDKDELKKRQAPGVLQAGQNLNDTWEGFISARVLEAIQQGATPDDFGLADADVVHAQAGLLLPDKYGRIFHPQQFGHLMIAEAIIRTMDDVAAKKMNQKAATTTLIGCPAPTGVASHSGEHNSCQSDGGDPNGATFTLSDANAAVRTFCLKHKGETVKVGDGDILDQMPNGGDASSAIIVRASVDTEPPCQNFKDIGQMNFFDCSDNLQRAMNDCDTSTTDKKMGGTRTADCISYSIRATTTRAAAKSYAPGTCSLHLTQKRDSQQDGSPFGNPDAPITYTVSVDIFDNNKVNIGSASNQAAGAGAPYNMPSKLPSLLAITPETQNDYVQFTIGTMASWKSSDKTSCSVGGWDPREHNPATREDHQFKQSIREQGSYFIRLRDLIFILAVPANSLSSLAELDRDDNRLSEYLMRPAGGRGVMVTSTTNCPSAENDDLSLEEEEKSNSGQDGSHIHLGQLPFWVKREPIKRDNGHLGPVLGMEMNEERAPTAPFRQSLEWN
ncbi:MAG: hypothetical protein Q9202_003376 [Teloschistes flavicans]